MKEVGQKSKKQRELLITAEAVCSPPEACGDNLFPFYADCIIIVRLGREKGNQ